MTAATLLDRALVRLSGEDVRGFLQGLVTNDLDRLAPERPLWAGLLTAQGKVLFDFLLWADGEDALIDCERAAADDLARRLALYRLRRPIVIGLEERFSVHWRSPAEAGAQASEGAGFRPSPEHIPDPRLAELGYRWLAPGSDDGGADEAWRAHRLSLGVTEGLAELGSDKTLWLECNAAELNGVSFDKGCYVGQENTARMNWRNKINRRLVVVPTAEAGPRTRILYPELGLAVEHRRIDDLGGAILPAWLGSALNRPLDDPSAAPA
jgi:tRNA-modifying protein YgfZ